MEASDDLSISLGSDLEDFSPCTKERSLSYWSLTDEEDFEDNSGMPQKQKGPSSKVKIKY